MDDLEGKPHYFRKHPYLGSTPHPQSEKHQDNMDIFQGKMDPNTNLQGECECYSVGGG